MGTEWGAGFVGVPAPTAFRPPPKLVYSHGRRRGGGFVAVRQVLRGARFEDRAPRVLAPAVLLQLPCDVLY